MNLLIVDDDHELRSVLARVSESYFDEVLAVQTAREALLVIDQQSPHVILTDWDLNESVSGVDILKYACEVSPKSRQAMITGKSITKLRQLTSDLYVDFYIEKPFTISELRTVLQALAEKS